MAPKCFWRWCFNYIHRSPDATALETANQLSAYSKIQQARSATDATEVTHRFSAPLHKQCHHNHLRVATARINGHCHSSLCFCRSGRSHCTRRLLSRILLAVLLPAPAAKSCPLSAVLHPLHYVLQSIARPTAFTETRHHTRNAIWRLTCCKHVEGFSSSGK